MGGLGGHRGRGAVAVPYRTHARRNPPSDSKQSGQPEVGGTRRLATCAVEKCRRYPLPLRSSRVCIPRFTKALPSSVPRSFRR